MKHLPMSICRRSMVTTNPHKTKFDFEKDAGTSFRMYLPKIDFFSSLLPSVPFWCYLAETTM